MCTAILRLPAVLLLLAFLSTCRLAHAVPTSQPSPATAHEQAEADAEPLLHPNSDAVGAAPKSDPTKLNLETPRVIGALAIVIGLIFLLRWGGRRFFNVPGATRSSDAVQVLSRSLLAPKQQILLLQVGKRVLVVGDSGGHMNSLCEITDHDEIAALVGQIREEKIGSSVRAFGSVFGRAKAGIEETEEAPPAISAQTDMEIVPEEREDPSLSATRDELSGLMEKIRLVSRQLRNG